MDAAWDAVLRDDPTAALYSVRDPKTRPTFEFAFMPGTDPRVDVLPEALTPGHTAGLQWRRPRDTLRELAEAEDSPYVWPWSLDVPEEVRLFTAYTYEYACTLTVRGLMQQTPWAASGFIVASVHAVRPGPDIDEALAAAWLT